MITKKDWERLNVFANTYRPERIIGPWGWETENHLPGSREILEFIEDEIGIKEHVKAPNEK